MHDAVEHDGPSLVTRVKSVIKFEVKDAGVWLVDPKTSPGSVKTATTADEAADVTITLSADTFLNMMDNKIVPQQVYIHRYVYMGTLMAIYRVRRCLRMAVFCATGAYEGAGQGQRQHETGHEAKRGTSGYSQVS